jgi:hypothetical protein
MSGDAIADIVTVESVRKVFPRSEQELVPIHPRGKLRRNGNPEKSFESDELASAVDTHILNAQEIQENEDQAKAKSDEGPMAPFSA